jgi:hypothetical protein
MEDLRKEILKRIESLPSPPKLSGILNKKIDEILHPLAEDDEKLYILDSAAHLIVETSDSIIQSLHKTLKYNLKKIVGGEK